MTKHFENPIARKLWQDYFAEVDRLIAHMGEDGREMRSDLEQHVRDSMDIAGDDRDEVARLEVALANLGQPIEYLRPVLADRYIAEGARTYNPVTIGKGLLHMVLSSSGRVLAGSLFALGYLSIGVFVAIALSKPFWSEQVGLFRYPDGTIAAGIVARSAGAEELLGWWSIPIALALAVLIYVLLTKGLRSILPKR